MKYEVRYKPTGERWPSTDTIVDQEGQVCWWNDAAGWTRYPDQSDFLVEVIEE